MPDEEDVGETALVFRLCESAPNLVREVFLEKGWKEFAEDEDETNDWNLWWKSSGFRTGDFEDIKPWQRINHFPKSSSISRKDSLVRGLRRMKGVYGNSIFNFSPVGFNLPNDYRKFVSEWSKHRQQYSESSVWICKPADLSRGRGIFIFRDLSELTFDGAAVVQKYIPNPLLISGYKLDLRIYVLVLSFHPLVIYTYHEGLVRFGTEKYDLSSLDNIYSHLTNTSINKFSPTYSTDKERIGQGCKWTLTQLRAYFRQMGMDDRLLWRRITSIIILTLLTQAPEIPNIDGSCFELFGFDILIDDDLKPWLIEVNFSPAMTHDCYLDVIIKKPLVNDLIELLNYTEIDSLRSGNDSSSKKSQKCKVGHKAKLRDRKSSKSDVSDSNHASKKGHQAGRREKKTLLKTCPEEPGPSVCKRSLKDDQSDIPTDDVNLSMASLSSVSGDVAIATDSTTDTSEHCKEDKEDICEKSCHSDEMDDQPDASANEVLPELCNTNVSPVFLQAYATTKSAQLCERRSAQEKENMSQEHSKTRRREHVDSADEIGFHPRPSQGKSSVFGKNSSKKNGLHSKSTSSLPRDDNRELGSGSRIGRSLSVDAYRSQSRLTLPSIYASNSSDQRKKYSDITSRYLTSRWQVRTRSLQVKREYPVRLGDFEMIFPFNETTKQASEGTIDSKTIVSEIRKIMKKLQSKINATETDQIKEGDEVERKNKPKDLSDNFWGLTGVER